jgi:hypothetical protein
MSGWSVIELQWRRYFQREDGNGAEGFSASGLLRSGWPLHGFRSLRSLAIGRFKASAPLEL